MPSTVVQARNLAELYKEVSEKYGNYPAFGTRNEKKVFETVTFRELYEMGVALATGFIDLGIEQREHVCLFSDNRFEWILVDYGIQLCGAVDVPRGSDVTDGDISYIVPHSDAKVVIVENRQVLEKVLRNRDKLTNIRHIIVMDKKTEVPEGVLKLYDILERGKRLRQEGDRRVEERMANIKEDDLFTLIYTSGTTGAPKGVMLTHKNIISQVNNVPEEIHRKLSPKDRVLSILPIWHIFERMFEMVCISRGICTYYTNVRNVREDLTIVKPTFMASAPRLWESVYQGILNRIESSPAIRQKLFHAAYYCSRKFHGAVRFLTFRELDTTGRSPVQSLILGLYHLFNLLVFAIPNLILDALVLSKIRAATGGQLKGSISGGGALPLHVDEFFNNIGIPVLEGYGMTETCPVLAVRTYSKLVPGTVGPLYPETELRLVDINTGEILFTTEPGGPKKKGVKGEIHVRGPQVMKGYYKNPEATAKVMDKDGWLNTGDLGMMTYNDCLKIVGRSKETIVLLGGENVEPVPIENRLLESPLIHQCMVVGQDKKYLAALIVPSLEQLKDYGSTYEELAKNEEVLRMLRNEVKRLVSGETGFKSFERIVDIRLLPKPFEVGDELTNLFKLRRHVVTEKYKDLIEEMYKEK